MNRVLLVCTANLIRSPLATVLLQKKLAQERFEEIQVTSAGTWAQPGLPVHVSVRALEGQYGIDLSEHRSKMIDTLMLMKVDLIYVMEANHAEALRVEFPDQMEKLHLISSLNDQTYDIPNPSGDIESCAALARKFTEIFEHALPVLMKHLEMKRRM